MKCPFCSASETRVVDSRLTPDAEQIRRRRECIECKARFSTYETADISLPKVVKSNGSRESFSEKKLRSGLSRALERRPVPTEQVETSIRQIKKHLISLGESEVTSIRIGEWVMDELRKLDKVAYIRFASVYRSFEDVQEFKDVIDGLE
jgi:transcriptional repressor NrdR